MKSLRLPRVPCPADSTSAESTETTLVLRSSHSYVWDSPSSREYGVFTQSGTGRNASFARRAPNIAVMLKLLIPWKCTREVCKLHLRKMYEAIRSKSREMWHLLDKASGLQIKIGTATPQSAGDRGLAPEGLGEWTSSPQATQFRCPRRGKF